jgi:alanine dehydrogenase
VLSVGVPRETKTSEFRVAITPEGVAELVHIGVSVFVEEGAGAGSSIPDAHYAAAGATVLASAQDVWAEPDLILKVKEPTPDEFHLLADGKAIFAYLHLAAHKDVAVALMDSGMIGIACETVRKPDGSLPLLAPMSEVAGRMAPHVAAHYLQRPYGGRGVLLGGAAGVRPARVVVLGAGIVGRNAAWISQGAEAEVVMIDKDTEKLRYVDSIHRGRIQTLYSSRMAIGDEISRADVVIGAALVPGARAPLLVTEDMVRTMKEGSVIVDVAIDQGGVCETSLETTHNDPVFEAHSVIHYGVSNMPGAVPHTSTFAFTNATLPYVLAICKEGIPAVFESHPELEGGVNVAGGRIVNEAVAGALGVDSVSVREVLG